MLEVLTDLSNRPQLPNFAPVVIPQSNDYSFRPSTALNSLRTTRRPSALPFSRAPKPYFFRLFPYATLLKSSVRARR